MRRRRRDLEGNAQRMVRVLQILDMMTTLRWHDIDLMCSLHGVDRRTLTRDVQLLRDLGLRLQRTDNHLRLTPCGLDELRAIMLEA